MEEIIKALGLLTAALMLMVFLGFVFTLPVMLLWNALLPELFNFPAIGFWQAMGINMLTGMLFRPYSAKKD